MSCCKVSLALKVKQASIWNQVKFPRPGMSGAVKWTDNGGLNWVITRVDAIENNNPSTPNTLIRLEVN
jgi:hypothetical protein